MRILFLFSLFWMLLHAQDGNVTTRMLVDMAQREVEVPQEVTRIVTVGGGKPFLDIGHREGQRDRSL